MKRNLKNYNRCVRYVYKKIRSHSGIVSADWWKEIFQGFKMGLLSLFVIIFSPVLFLIWAILQLCWYVLNILYWFEGKELKNPIWKEIEKQIEEEEKENDQCE